MHWWRSIDLAWARDASGNAVAMDSANFVRLEVLSGKAEVDGLAAVPEPGGFAVIGRCEVGEGFELLLDGHPIELPSWEHFVREK